MILTVKKIFQIIIVILLFNLTGCGGGGLPSAPDSDIEAPYVIKTQPKSEFSGLNTSEFIVITFNENINTVDTNQVFINKFIGTTLESNAVTLKLNDEFEFNPKNNELTIKPNQNALVANTKYQVTIKNVKDIYGNVMTDTCLLIFATSGFPAITTGNTGLCGTDPDSVGKPGVPQNVNVTTSETSATITWQIPGSGGVPTEYIIEKSTGIGSIAFKRLAPSVTSNSLSFIDPAVLQYGESYTYQVIAKNKAGESAPTVSNTFIPTKVIVAPGAPQNVNAVAVVTSTSTSVKYLAGMHH